MADVTPRIAPYIDQRFIITAEFGRYPSGGIHRGFDMASFGPNYDIYSISDGVVIRNAYNESGYGNFVIIKASNGMGFLYAHLQEASPLRVGTEVREGTRIGIEGATGNVTGRHLHLEMQDLSTHDWEYNQPISAYENPANFMGIPNVVNTTVYYDGTPEPPDPPDPPEHAQNNWKMWRLSQGG